MQVNILEESKTHFSSNKKMSISSFYSSEPWKLLSQDENYIASISGVNPQSKSFEFILPLTFSSIVRHFVMVNNFKSSSSHSRFPPFICQSHLRIRRKLNSLIDHINLFLGKIVFWRFFRIVPSIFLLKSHIAVCSDILLLLIREHHLPIPLILFFIKILIGMGKFIGDKSLLIIWPPKVPFLDIFVLIGKMSVQVGHLILKISDCLLIEIFPLNDFW